MLANVGYFSLVLAFLVALYGAGAAAYGARRRLPALVESGRRAMLLTFPLVSLGALAIILLLLTGHYEIEYVASVTSNTMPGYLKLTALWGGQPGSLVFWSWLLAAFTSAASLRKWDRDRELLPWVIVVTMVTLAFFLSLVILFENPFARLWQTPAGEQVTAMFQPAGALPLTPRDGQGLNPLLRHPGMIIHPPMLYLGFVSFVIPYAFAIAALVTGRTDDRWIRITRRWTLVAWLFLSLGLILGGRWAYDVLGWGGYWGWDPVEIAAFMPWLSGTALLHSVMIQEKRGILKHWNMVLIILTYALVIFGTFLTRSGVLSSVHAFAQSAIGPMFFAFIGITAVASVALLISRWSDLKGENQLDSVLSREALFLLNNLLFMGILVVCFWGVLFPLISELATGQKVTVGPPFYERATAPLWAGLLLLMGVAPLSAYGRTSAQLLGRAIWKPFAASLLVPIGLVTLGQVKSLPAILGLWLASLVGLVTLYEFWRGTLARHRRHAESWPLALWRLAGRNRRRYGGYVIHLGVVLMAFGIIGIEIFQSETQGTLAQGEQLTIGRYVMVYDSLAEFDTADGRNVARAVVSVFRDGEYLTELHPRRDYYYVSQQQMTIPGVRSSLEDDFYVLLVGWEPIAAEGATFKIYRNPLVNFVWLGGLVFILGTLVAAWPEREPAAARQFAPARTSFART
ncbi:MAG TPA: heme lyase CcmF/NrfE family subunit [Anaerolineales bacterium]|nr:heme lyase CcmF/NrfE family subunit [Anaerolineales bacterium]